MRRPRKPRPAPVALESPVLLPEEAASYLRVVTAATLESWRVRPPRTGAPRHVKAGGKIGYLREELDRWLHARQRLSTSDEMPAAEADAAKER